MKKQADIDVFISYSSKDQKEADHIVENLEQYGLKCWIASRDIPQGTLWADAIEDAISRARIFLIVVGQNSISSVQVSKELGLAITSCETIIPYRIDRVELKGAFRYYLSDCQWFNGQVKNQKNMDAFAISVCEILGKKAVKQKASAGASGTEGTASGTSTQDGDKWATFMSTPKGRNLVLGVVLAGIVLSLVSILVLVIPKNTGEGAKAGTAPEGTAATVSDGDMSEELEDAGFTPLVLKAGEEATVYDFMYAEQVIRGRMDAYFGEGNYEMEFDDTKTKLYLSLPTAKLAVCDMRQFVVSYLVRPRELFLARKEFEVSNPSAYIPIAREEIKKVEICKGKIDEWNLSDYPNAPEEYEYMEISLSDEVAKEVKELAYKTEEFRLVQDISGTDCYYYKFVQVSEAGDKIRFLDTNFNHEINELAKHVFSNETFKSHFTGAYEAPVIWDHSEFGTCQKEVDALEGTLSVGIYIVPDNYEATETGSQDLKSRIRGQLDEIGLPYALGRLAYDKYSVVVGLEAEKVPEKMYKWLLQSSFYQLTAGSETLYLTENTAKVSQKKIDSKLCLVMEFSDMNNSYRKESVMKLQEASKAAPVMLVTDSNSILEGHFEGDTVVFDRSVYSPFHEGQSGLDAKFGYTLSFVENQINGGKKNNGNYSFYASEFKHRDFSQFGDKEYERYGIDYCYYDDLFAEDLKALTEQYPQLSGSWLDYDNRICINAHLSKEEINADMISEIFERIYSESYLKKYGRYVKYISLTFFCEDREFHRIIIREDQGNELTYVVYQKDYKELCEAVQAKIKALHPKVEFGLTGLYLQ